MAYRYTGTTKQKQSPKRKSTIGGTSNLKSSKRISWKFAAPLIAIVALVGGYTVFRSFAAEPAVESRRNGNLLFYEGPDNDGITRNRILDLGSGTSSNNEMVKRAARIFGSSSDGEKIYFYDGFHREIFSISSINTEDGTGESIITDNDKVSFDADEYFGGALLMNSKNKIVMWTIEPPVVLNGGYSPVYKSTYIINIDGTEFRKILSSSELDGYPDFKSTYDDKLLVTTNKQQFILNPSTGEKSIRMSRDLAYPSPLNPESVSAVPDWTDKTKIKITNYETGQTRSINSPVGYSYVWIRSWSPDGTKLVANIGDSDQTIGEKREIRAALISATTGEVLSFILDHGVDESLVWQSLLAPAEPIPTKKPSEPTPPETPTKTNTQIVTEWYYTCLNRAPDSAGLTYWKGRLDKGESAASVAQAFMAAAKVTACNYPAAPPTTPPPAPTTYTEDATKLVVPTNTPYIQRITSPSKYIIIKPGAYNYQQYISFADKASVINFLKVQQAANKRVKVCVTTRTSAYTSMLMLRKLSGTTHHNITIAKNTLGKKHCTSAIAITSTMTTSPIMQVATAQAGDVLIDSASIEVE